MKLKSTEAVDTWNFREEVKKDWVLKLEKELEVNWEHATQGICLFPGDNINLPVVFYRKRQTRSETLMRVWF